MIHVFILIIVIFENLYVKR